MGYWGQVGWWIIKVRWVIVGRQGRGEALGGLVKIL